MEHNPSTPGPDKLEQRYEDLVDALVADPDVTPPGCGRGFGRTALRVHGKIFAMLVRGSLVLKLPEPRVSQLIADGQGTNFDANKGKPMKEWLTLAPDSDQDWPTLAREALAFVRTQR